MNTPSLPVGWNWERSMDPCGRTEWELYDAVRETRKRRVRRRKVRATIFRTGAWFTWDERGTGGENDVTVGVEAAKRACEAALVRQGWM